MHWIRAILKFLRDSIEALAADDEEGRRKRAVKDLYWAALFPRPP